MEGKFEYTSVFYRFEKSLADESRMVVQRRFSSRCNNNRDFYVWNYRSAGAKRDKPQRLSTISLGIVIVDEARKIATKTRRSSL